MWCWKKLFKSPLDNKEIKSSVLKEINSEYSLEGTDAEAPILQPPDAKSWLTGKDADAGKDWRQEEKVTTEDGMVDGIID